MGTVVLFGCPMYLNGIKAQPRLIDDPNQQRPNHHHLIECLLKVYIDFSSVQKALLFLEDFGPPEISRKVLSVFSQMFRLFQRTKGFVNLLVYSLCNTNTVAQWLIRRTHDDVYTIKLFRPERGLELGFGIDGPIGPNTSVRLLPNNNEWALQPTGERDQYM